MSVPGSSNTVLRPDSVGSEMETELSKTSQTLLGRQTLNPKAASDPTSRNGTRTRTIWPTMSRMTIITLLLGRLGFLDKPVSWLAAYNEVTRTTDVRRTHKTRMSTCNNVHPGCMHRATNLA